MRNWKFFSALLTLLLALALVGCSNASVNPGTAVSDPNELTQEEVGEVEVVEQFESVRQAVDSYLSSDQVAGMTAEELYQIIGENNPDYVLVDIRANSDFVNSNIKGSLSIPYGETMNKEKLEALPKDKTLVVIDYNGHQSGQTAATWNLLGYKAVPLLYGMQSWTSEIAPIGYEALPDQPLLQPLVQEGTLPQSEFTQPEIKYPKGETQEYILTAAKIYLDRNYKGLISAEELLDALAKDSQDIYLVDIRDALHYNQGHIRGSINIPLQKLADSDHIKALPSDKRIVLIGYNGVDASLGVRSLITLGYDAVALKYGMSYWSGQSEAGIIPINQVPKDYPLVPLNYVQPSTAAAGCG